MEDKEALEEEKKKNLSILQRVLGTGQQASGKTAGKAKQFRWESVWFPAPPGLKGGV